MNGLTPNSADNGTDKQLYMEITGTIMRAAHSCRPDLAHGARSLACRMQAPTSSDNTIAAKRMLRYLAGTKEVGILFGKNKKQVNGVVDDSTGRYEQEIQACAYADADWPMIKQIENLLLVG